MRKIIFLFSFAVFLILILNLNIFNFPNNLINNQVISNIPIPTSSTVIGAQKAIKTSDCVINNSLQDKDYTPGAIDPNVTQDNIQNTICVSGYTQKVRPAESITNKIKIQQMKAYGFTDQLSNYELDHLIPLELGGCPDCVTNLWPEPALPTPGFHEKDKVENYLHKEVCEGKISLQEAQQEIATDWLKVYQQIQP